MKGQSTMLCDHASQMGIGVKALEGNQSKGGNGVISGDAAHDDTSAPILKRLDSFNSLQRHLQTMEHASRCMQPECDEECYKMKALMHHVSSCAGFDGSCRVCRRFHVLLSLHVEHCGRTFGHCGVPWCSEAKASRSCNPVVAEIAGAQINQNILRTAQPTSKCVTQRLVLLRHAWSCTNGQGANGTTCSTSQHCFAMKEALNHVMFCKDEDCATQFCASSKFALSHFATCSEQTCPICLPLRRPVTSHARDCPDCSAILCVNQQ